MGFNDLKKFKQSTAGGLEVTITSPSTTFGGIEVAELEPVAQGDFVYGINNQIFITSSFVGSSVTTGNSMASISSGTSPTGSADVKLRRGLKYKPGEGSLMRGTAIFDTPVDGNQQLIGLSNPESGYYIGYSGSTFGVLHESTAATEIRRLTITGVDAAAQDITITLDGVATIVNIDGNSEPGTAAYLISQNDFSQVGNTGWTTDVISSSVYFISSVATPKLTNTYSATGVGFTGTFSRFQVGAFPTSDFIPSSSFNLDRLDGTGFSGMTLDPQKGNVYQIGFQYLGFGNAKFFVFNAETGKPTQFHEIRNINTRTIPVLKNPNNSVTVTSRNNGGTTSKTIKTASLAAFTEGQIKRLDPKFAKSVSFSNVNEANYVPLLLIKSDKIHRGVASYGEIDFLKLGGTNLVNNQSLTIALFLNTTVTADTINFVEIDPNNSTTSIAILDPSNDTIANLADISPFYEVGVGPASSVLDTLDDLDFIFGAGQVVTVAIKTTASMSGGVVLTWFEQQ